MPYTAHGAFLTLCALPHGRARFISAATITPCSLITSDRLPFAGVWTPDVVQHKCTQANQPTATPLAAKSLVMHPTWTCTVPLETVLSLKRSLPVYATLSSTRRGLPPPKNATILSTARRTPSPLRPRRSTKVTSIKKAPSTGLRQNGGRYIAAPGAHNHLATWLTTLW